MKVIKLCERHSWKNIVILGIGNDQHIALISLLRSRDSDCLAHAHTVLTLIIYVNLISASTHIFFAISALKAEEKN